MLGPISTSKLNVLLRDPYYIGYVTYKGELIRGRHQPLISEELFDRVQACSMDAVEVAFVNTATTTI